MSRKIDFIVKSDNYVYVPDRIYDERAKILRKKAIPFNLIQEILDDGIMCEYEKLEIINGISSGYEIKPESERVYAWRKKKEHLALFEDNIYLRVYHDGDKALVGADMNVTYLSRGKAADILGDDFEKFEIVK